MISKEFYKFLFLIDGVNILIEANSKIEAINTFKEEYEHLFNKDFNIIRINREVTLSGEENLFL